MSIEKALQDLTEALNANTEALKASGTKKTTKKTTTKKAAATKPAEAEAPGDDGLDDDAPSGPTREDVKNALKEYAALEGKSAAIGILKENGASSIGELAEDKFQAVIDATSS